MVPKSGPYNLSGEWDGVMGSVVKKKYDLSISAWDMDISRVNVLQLSPIRKNTYVNVYAPRRPKFDYGLLTRTLTVESWSGILSMVVVFGLTSFFIQVDKEQIDGSQTTQIVK